MKGGSQMRSITRIFLFTASCCMALPAFPAHAQTKNPCLKSAKKHFEKIKKSVKCSWAEYKAAKGLEEVAEMPKEVTVGCLYFRYAKDGSKLPGVFKRDKLAFQPDKAHENSTGKILKKDLQTGCKQLRFRHYKLTNEGGSNRTATATTPTVTHMFQHPDKMIQGMRNEAEKGTEIAQTGRAHANVAGAIGTAVKETIHILGEIVVERATSYAYSLIRTKILQFLECEVDGLDANTEAFGKLHLKATCSTVKSVRIQDLATAPRALANALISDAMAFLGDKVGSQTDKRFKQFKRLLLSALLPELLKPRDSVASVNMETLARSIATWIVDELRFSLKVISFSTLKKGEQALALAGLAYLDCEQRIMKGEYSRNMEQCPILHIVDGIAGRVRVETAKEAKKAAEDTKAVKKDKLDKQEDKRFTLAQLDVARRIAQRLIDAATLKGTDGKPSVRLRLAAGLDAFFSASCLVLDPEKAACPERVVFEAGSKTELTAPQAVTLLRKLALAAVEKDTNALVTAALNAFSVLIELSGDTSRGMRLVAGLLSYAETYTQADEKQDKKALHEHRKNIIKSLTEHMTDRADRGDEWVISVGGSLRLKAGANLCLNSADGTGFDGPISLSLGFAMNRYYHREDVGIHLEVGLVDLGEYVSFESGGEVREPEGLELFYPSFTAGVFFGRQFPMTVGMTVGYSPYLDLKPENTEENYGAISIALTAGIYVPLWDFN